jgi:BirA family transcriptional regulator, biotin operon repressor / biotin---[acetyl-CoA-carboxylase] ligase
MLLDPARLPELLGSVAAYFDVDSVAEIDSTNDELGRRITRGLPSGSVLVADRQMAGKGRQGRVWVSDAAASLTFSLYWRFALPPQKMLGLSLAVGLGIHRALTALGAKNIGLKWPNDVLCQRANGEWSKLAGVLIELSPNRKGVDAVIGIGLNLLPVSVNGLSGLLPAALSEVLSPVPDRHAVLAELLKALHPILQRFTDEGLTPLKSAWESAHAWQGQRVSAVASVGENIRSGVCVGINAEGALLLETEFGLEAVMVGDVSLRLPENLSRVQP